MPSMIMEHSSMNETSQRKVSVSRHYISQKPSRIKWKPEGNDMFADHFVAGSWDNGENNNVSLWYIQKNTENELVNSGPPICKQKIIVEDDVTDLKFVDNSNFVYATSGGNVSLVSVKNEKDGYEMKSNMSWKIPDDDGKSKKVSCNVIDSNETDIIIGSEDGQIRLLSTLKENQLGTLGVTGISSIQTLCFLRHNEVIAGDLRGLFRVWDLRTTSKPTMVFPYASTQVVGISAAAVFPTQKHIFIGGASDGSITVWDLRKTTIPNFVYNAHQTKVTYIHHHYTRPSNMFTCSENGEIWHWHNFEKHFTTQNSPVRVDERGLPKYTRVEKTLRPRVTSIRGVLSFPMNSVDSNRVRLIGGSDLECAIIVQDLELDQF